MNNKDTSNRARQLTTLLLTQGVVAVAHAQSTNSTPATPAGTNSPAKLPEITVTGRADSYKTDSIALPKITQPLRDTPQSISVVPREVMNDQNDTTLRDVLRNVAGISIAAGEGGSQGDNLTLRGFTARNDIFLDGMRDFGSYYRDPFNYEEVDVLEGPEAVMFGRGSTGGVINQVSRTPELVPSVAGSLTLGTDNTRRATADINEPIPEFGKGTALRLDLMGNDSMMAGRDVGENRRLGIAPTMIFNLDKDTRLTISYYHQSEFDTPDYGVPWVQSAPAAVPHNFYYGFLDDYLNTQVNMGTVKLERDFNDNLTIRDQFRYADYGRQFRITEPTKLTNAPVAGQLIQRNELGGNSTETFLWDQLDATIKFNTTSFVEHTVVTGVEGGRETSDPTRFAYTNVPPTLLYAPNENQYFSGTFGPKSIVTTTANSFGVYGLDTIKLGEHWELAGGGRWDYFGADFHEAITNGNFNQNITKFSYRGALVYKPVENGSIYFDYGTSWNPSAETLSLSSATVDTPPEENETFEVGSKWDFFSNRLSVRGAIFRTEKTNAREPDPNDPTQNVLGGDELVDGIEIAISGHLTKEWQILASYDYLASKVVSSKDYPLSVGQPLANVPKHTASIWTTYDLPWNFQIGGGFAFVGRRFANTTTLTPGVFEESAGSYWTLSAMAKYNLNKHVTLQANIYNLTDNQFYDQLHPSHVIPGAGVSALFSTSFKF